MENEAIGRNFTLTPTEGRIFHVTGKQHEDGEWWFRDRLTDNRDFQVYPAATMLSIENYIEKVERAGKLDRAKLIVVKPIMALALYSWGVIPIEQFQQVAERSSGYFDLSGSELSDTLPVRVAQHPGGALMLTDERGYQIYEP